MPVAPQLELCWGTARGVGLPELIDVARSAGYPTLTVSPILYFEALRDGYTGQELRKRLSDAGVVISTIDPLSSGLPGAPGPAEAEPRLRAFCLYGERDCFDAARELGAHTVNVAAFLSGPVQYTQMLDYLGPLAGRASAEGLTVSMEFIPGTGLGDLQVVRSLCRDVGAPNIGITFDTWHFHRSGGIDGDLGALDEVAPLVRSLQLSDAVVTDSGGPYVPMRDRLLPGEGDLPLAELVRPFLKGDAPVAIGLEIFQKRLRQGPPLEAAKIARDRTLAALGSL